MNLFAGTPNPFGNMYKPLFLLLGFGIVTAILVRVITRRLPRVLGELVAGVLALASLALWGWLVFYRNIFPGI